MFRNTYDSDITVFSPQGQIWQIAYAQEAIKQGSAVVGLRSNTHAVLVALKRAPSELASYQNKMLRVDNHVGIAFAGLTSDARVLSNYMRQLALSSRMLYARPLPLSRIASALADRAQLNTMQYGKRPYGVGFLIIGVDGAGPHLFEFSPTGNCLEYVAMALGARSASAKTYLERNFEKFPEASLDDLLLHGLTALRDTLPQSKELDLDAISVSLVGPGADADLNTAAARSGEKFRIIEGDELKPYFDRIPTRVTAGSAAAAAAAATETSTEATESADPGTGDMQE
ncbi:unnamed protein product [Tilletia controversa]|uniref:Proteasome alpha-type subunits domain-containing protein n=4 Tax=Tilletia TaxID=13289 RepID=A0ABN7ILV3_9BASI|nr:unnamed protein product [Tilletia caries]CAD6928615.1 unnamed protein product [Tilletia controversa]CAD6910263.1 unnamed protein product [Tilletia caries]CAD6930228.1 unnamed protein product [Tilletia controversa]CAD6945170.1 unnamed protein product [Tilletia controversa]